jgi:dihydroneopterin aldolase
MVDTRPASASDRLNDTVNYAEVARRVAQIGTETQYRLLEALARHIVEAIFAEFPLVQGVELRVQKIHPPMNAIVASVGVEITRERSAL